MNQEKKGVIDKLIDDIFSIRKTTVYLIVIFLFGLILRFVAALNISVFADDMHHVIHAINFLEANRLVLWDQSSGLWHAFTDLMYHLFGYTQLSSRLASVIFGSLSIALIFILTKEFYDERIALFSAFLLAIAPFHIFNTMAEMDLMTMFFVLISMVLFIKATKKENRKGLLCLGGVSMGLAIYTKVYPILFIPSLLLYFSYSIKQQKSKLITYKHIKEIAIFLLAIFVFTIPVLAHNFLLYQDKGFLDLQFTRSFGLGKNISEQYYGWTSDFHTRNSWAGLFLGDTEHVATGTPLLLAAINYIRMGDPLVFYLGLGGLGISLIKRKKKDYILFFFLSIAFALPFLASIILLPKHYIFLELLLVPLAAFFLKSLFDKPALKHKFSQGCFIIAIFFLSLFMLGSPSVKGFYQPNNFMFYGQSSVAQLINYKIDSIPQDTLIVTDSRMYRGRINWISYGRPYLEGADFINAISQQNTLPGNTILTDVYYIECVPDDCGWGTIKDQPDFNASMEQLTDFFIQNGELLTTIKEPSRSEAYYPVISKDGQEETAKIYKIKIPIKKEIIEFAKMPKNWFLYNVGYFPKEGQFDYYKTHSIFDSFLDKLAHWIVYLALFLSFLSPFVVIYLVFKNED